MNFLIKGILKKGVELVVGTALTGGVSIIGMEYLNSKQQSHIIKHYEHSDDMIMKELEELKIELKRLKDAKS